MDVTVFDNDHADCALVQTADGENVVVDADLKSGAQAITDRLDENEPIDSVALTHHHQDHAKGLGYLLTDSKPYHTVDSKQVDNVVRQPTDRVENESRGIVEALDSAEENREDVTFHEATAGDELPVQSEDASFDVLSPPEDLEDSTLQSGDENENSLVIRASDGGRTHLFTGDIGETAEQEIPAESVSGVDVLHASHHGATASGDSHKGGTKGNTEQFLADVDPGVLAVSSAQKDQYGHPDPRLMKRAADQDIGVGWTGVHGDLSEDEFEAAQSGDPLYDPQEILKIRAVAEHQRSEAAEELEETGEVALSGYALDTELFETMKQTGPGEWEKHGYNIEVGELEEWTNTERLGENAKLGAVAEADFEEAREELETEGTIDLSNYDCKPDVESGERQFTHPALDEAGQEPVRINQFPITDGASATEERSQTSDSVPRTEEGKRTR